MAGKRKQHTAAFKAQVALATLKGDKTANELASQYGVHPTLIHAWKKQLLAGADQVFSNGSKVATADAEAEKAELFEQIGRLKMELVRLIDREYTAHPFLGSRRLTKWLVEQGEAVNRKRVQRLMRLMGLEAIYPKPKLSAAGRGHRIYPYLLRDVRIQRPDQVWSTDITYVVSVRRIAFLTAVVDWFSRYVIAWRLSNTLDGSFCLEMLEEALRGGRPEVFNTDQGVQFTSAAWTGRLESAGVAVSMDGKGRCLDNVFVERLWRTVKYEDLYR